MGGKLLARAALVLVVSAFTLGCGGGSKYPGATVSGTVSLDGKPIEQGTIDFVPAGAGQGQAASAAITAGKYSAQKVPLGKVMVSFRAQHKTGKMIPGSSEPVPEIINPLPAKYAAPGVPADIPGDDANRNFELKTGE